jgi:hypothetical protein
MTKKKSKFKKAKELSSKPLENSAREGVREEGVEPVDFGGLPLRDMKKNLGCG